MMDTENKPKIKLEDIYKPPKNIMEAIFDVYEKYLRWKALRDAPYKQHNNSVITDWWTESREKFWGYIPLSYDNDTPQFFFPETRNQITQILSKLAAQKMKPKFEGVEGFDIIKATILKDFFEYWRRSGNKKIENFWSYLYTVINGTCIKFIAYKSNVRKVKNITYHDPKSGETRFKEEELDDSDVESIICNLEDIYIPKLWEPDIQKQDEIIWRTLYKWTDFKNAFKGYSDVDKVIPGMQFADTSIFSDFMSYDVKGGDFVEVFKYFNVPLDRYMIVANGVLLNPIKEGEDLEICPLPWNHKMLPFAKTVFEPMDASWFWGMSLPMKVKDPQNALNRMMELFLEREERSVSKPILTNDPTAENGLEMKAGRIYQITGDPGSSYRELDVSPTSPSSVNLVNSLQGLIKTTSQGGSGSFMFGRQPRSATEKAQEAQIMKENSGLNYMFYEDLMEQQAWLVIQNMIQFYTSAKTEKTLGDKKYHKILSLIDIQLAGGGIGNREIRITDSPRNSEELNNESWERSMFKKEKVEIIEVSPQELRQIKFDIKIDFESELSPESERALYMDYIHTIYNLFGPLGLIDMKKLLFKTVEKFDDSIVDVVPDNLISEYEKERFGISQPVQNTGMPAINNYNQSLRGQMYGAGGPAQGMENAMGIDSPLQGQMPNKGMTKFIDQQMNLPVNL